MINRRMTLDPADPVALELARLYDELLATHLPEFEVYKALSLRAVPVDGPEWYSIHGDEIAYGLFDEYNARRTVRRAAYSALLDAVLDAAGNPEFDEIEWWRFGLPLVVVTVGTRLYVANVLAEDNYDFVRDYQGDAELSVIDL